MTISSPNLGDKAQELVDDTGWCVFPVGANYDRLKRKWHKYPLTPNGHKDASNDPSIFDWSRAKYIGIATGQKSGIAVLDQDDGEDLDLPLTLTVESLSGRGKHYYFKHQPGITNKQGWPAIGWDVRGEGGWVAWSGKVILDEDLAPWPSHLRPEEAERKSRLIVKDPDAPLNTLLDEMRDPRLHKGHESVRQFAAMSAARGIPEELTERIVRDNVHTWDTNAQNLITSAYDKYFKAEDSDENGVTKSHLQTKALWAKIRDF